jgi:hypothetical protein
MVEETSTTYVISASHSKKFSSLIGPAIIPSGGFRVSSETCKKRAYAISLGYNTTAYNVCVFPEGKSGNYYFPPMRLNYGET